MNIKPLLAAALIAVGALPLHAQDANDKDKKKAAKLAAKDKDFASLPDDEKDDVILFIANEIHGHRRRATKANISVFKGAKVDSLKKKVSKSSIVIAEQDKEAVHTPGSSRLDVRHTDTPPLGKLFKDNEWTVDTASPEAEALRQNMDRLVDTLKKGNGKLVSMHVESSASTLRNTGKAAGMTHLELSKARAEAAAQYSIDYLKSKGYEFLSDEQITLDYEGSNKNGTSGPSSPFGIPVGDDLKFHPAGSCEAPPEAKAAAVKGDRAVIEKFYDENKYVQITFDSVFEVSDAKPPVDIPGEAHVVAATVDYKERPEIHLPRIRLPRIHIGWPFGNKEQRMARRAVRCPKWH